MRSVLSLILFIGFCITSNAQFDLTEIARIDTGFSTTKISGYHLIACHSASPELSIFNVIDFANPQHITTVPAGTGGIEMSVRDDLILVGTDNALLIYDWSNPALPTQIGSMGFTQPVTSVLWENNFAFVTTSQGPAGKVFSIDINNPSNPFKRDSIQYNHALGRTQINDGTLYLPIYLVGNSQGESIDVTDPNNMMPVTTLVLPNFTQFDIASDRLMALDTTEIRVYTLVDPYSPVLEKSIPIAVGSLDFDAIDSAHFALLQTSSMSGVEETASTTHEDFFSGNGPDRSITAYENLILYSTENSLYILHYTTPIHTLVEEKKPADISVYPNPSNGIFTVEVQQQMQYIEVIDLTGKCVYSRQVNGSLLSTTIQPNLPQGAYLLSVHFSDGSVGSSSLQIME